MSFSKRNPPMETDDYVIENVGLPLNAREIALWTQDNCYNEEKKMFQWTLAVNQFKPHFDAADKRFKKVRNLKARARQVSRMHDRIGQTLGRGGHEVMEIETEDTDGLPLNLTNGGKYIQKKRGSNCISTTLSAPLNKKIKLINSNPSKSSAVGSGRCHEQLVVIDLETSDYQDDKSSENEGSDDDSETSEDEEDDGIDCSTVNSHLVSSDVDENPYKLIAMFCRLIKRIPSPVYALNKKEAARAIQMVGTFFCLSPKNRRHKEFQSLLVDPPKDPIIASGGKAGKILADNKAALVSKISASTTVATSVTRPVTKPTAVTRPGTKPRNTTAFKMVPTTVQEDSSPANSDEEDDEDCIILKDTQVISSPKNKTTSTQSSKQVTKTFANQDNIAYDKEKFLSCSIEEKEECYPFYKAALQSVLDNVKPRHKFQQKCKAFAEKAIPVLHFLLDVSPSKECAKQDTEDLFQSIMTIFQDSSEHFVTFMDNLKHTEDHVDILTDFWKMHSKYFEEESMDEDGKANPIDTSTIVNLGPTTVTAIPPVIAPSSVTEPTVTSSTAVTTSAGTTSVALPLKSVNNTTTVVELICGVPKMTSCFRKLSTSDAQLFMCKFVRLGLVGFQYKTIKTGKFLAIDKLTTAMLESFWIELRKAKLLNTTSVTSSTESPIPAKIDIETFWNVMKLLCPNECKNVAGSGIVGNVKDSLVHDDAESAQPAVPGVVTDNVMVVEEVVMVPIETNGVVPVVESQKEVPGVESQKEVPVEAKQEVVTEGENKDSLVHEDAESAQPAVPVVVTDNVMVVEEVVMVPIETNGVVPVVESQKEVPGVESQKEVPVEAKQEVVTEGEKLVADVELAVKYSSQLTDNSSQVVAIEPEEEVQTADEIQTSTDEVAVTGTAIESAKVRPVIETDLEVTAAIETDLVKPVVQTDELVTAVETVNEIQTSTEEVVPVESKAKEPVKSVVTGGETDKDLVTNLIDVWMQANHRSDQQQFV